MSTEVHKILGEIWKTRAKFPQIVSTIIPLTFSFSPKNSVHYIYKRERERERANNCRFLKSAICTRTVVYSFKHAAQWAFTIVVVTFVVLIQPRSGCLKSNFGLPILNWWRLKSVPTYSQFFYCREKRVPWDGYPRGPKCNKREMRFSYMFVLGGGREISVRWVSPRPETQ